MPPTQTILTGGASSSVILQQTGDERVVIKESIRADLRTEHRALELAHQAGVPVPAVINFANNRLTLEWIDGRTITAADYSAAFFGQLSAVIQTLHRIETPSIGRLLEPQPYSLSGWFQFLKTSLHRQLDYLVRHGQLTAAQSTNYAHTWTVRYQQLPPREFQPTLIHGDIHIDNILLTPDGRQYLIDFEDAFYGDPLFEFAVIEDFHPDLRAGVQAHTQDPRLWSAGWQDWFEVYAFVQSATLAAFNVDVNDPPSYLKRLKKMEQFYNTYTGKIG